MAEGEATTEEGAVGPVLHMRGVREGRVQLTAILILPRTAFPPQLTGGDAPVEGRVLATRLGRQVVAYDFALPATSDAAYELQGRRYAVNAAFEGDLRIAYVACNGQEEADPARSEDERDVMWRRLARQHEEAPFNLILHGGDQLYADEVVEADPLSAGWPHIDPPALDEAKAERVTEALRDAFFERYVGLYSHPALAELFACIPSLAMWDDHDICDGWGSLRETRLDSRLGRIVFATARENFLVFQLGVAPGEVPATCLDPSGASLSWHVALPGVHVLAPDLRSERRPNRVMGEAGWSAFDAALEGIGEGRLLLMSSVPALGPRLSIVESLMRLTPAMEKYEDDLRDQWQSQAHRDEWRAFLTRLAKTHEKGVATTVLSGEIHLATRGTLSTAATPLHQLVASGIAHPAPPAAYARCLGALARFGASPLPGHDIRLHPLPGQRPIYMAERNYLVLERRDGEWSAFWELERSGPTPPLGL